MATALRTQGIVYRRGTATDSNLTPRPGRDTVWKPGQEPGLSTLETLVLKPGEKAQVIDLALLQAPLSAFADDPHLGGTPGHVAIAPVDAAGVIDQQRLDDWAASRGTGRLHPLTQIVRTALVGQVVGR